MYGEYFIYINSFNSQLSMQADFICLIIPILQLRMLRFSMVG